MERPGGESEQDCSEVVRQRLAAGDRHCLAEYYSDHHDRFWRLVHFRLDPRLAGRVDADDVLQEAYLDASKRIEHFVRQDPDERVSLFVWLRSIVLQTLIDVHRRHLLVQQRDARREISIHRPDRFPAATSISIAAQLLGHLTSPSQAAIRDELTVQLEEAIEQMEPIDREVLTLRHFEELSNREVAEVLGIEQKAASIRYVRAIARLRAVLEQIPGFGDSQA